MFIKLLTVLSILFLSEAITQDQGSSDGKRNPIVNLFEAPLKAFRTRPGEAIAVFQPEMIKVETRQENGTDSPTSWFPAELGTIGSAAQSLLPQWLSGRTTTTTSKPEIIIQVHQNDRNRQHPILNIGPVNGNSSEDSDEDDNSDEDNSDEDDDNEDDDNEKGDKVVQKKKKKPTKKPASTRRRRPAHNDDDDDDDDDEEEVDEDVGNRKRRPSRRKVVLQRLHGDSYYSDQMHRRKKVDYNRTPLTDRIFLIDDEDFLDDIEFLHRHFGDKDVEIDTPYYSAEDEDDLPLLPRNDGRKLGNARYGPQVRRQQPKQREQQNNQKQHRDTVDEINIRMKLKNPHVQQKQISEEQIDNLIRKELIREQKLRRQRVQPPKVQQKEINQEEIDNEIRKELIREENLRRQRLQQKRRNQQNIANNQKKNSEKVPMKDFLQPFQDNPSVGRPMRHGQNVRRKPIGVLQMEENDRIKKLEAQQQREKKLEAQQQQREKDQKEAESNFQVHFDYDNQQPQKPQLHQSHQSHQPQHILIPIHVIPPSIPYKDVMPQVVPQHIQVVAQHHHTVQHADNEAYKPVRPNKKKKKPVIITYDEDEDDEDDENDDDNEDDDDDDENENENENENESEEEEEVVYKPVQIAHPTRRPSSNKNKKKVIVANRPKPVIRKQVLTPKRNQQQRLRQPQKPMKDVQKPIKEAEKPVKEAQKPMKEIQKPMNDKDRPDISMDSEETSSDEKKDSYSNAPLLPPGIDSMDDDDIVESKESKESEGRAQYYLPQRYFQILGTDKYLSVGNTGKFLLKTGRKLENNESEAEKTDKKEEVAKVEEVKVDEVAKEVVPEKAIEKKVHVEKPEIIKEVSKPKDEIKPIVDVEHNLDLVISKTTEATISIKPTKEIVPVVIVKPEEQPPIKNIEKVFVRSEIVQEKQNGHFVVRSEPKIRSYSS